MAFEKFIESIQSLPCDLERNFTLIEDLDTKCGSLHNDLKMLETEFIEKAEQMSSDEKYKIHEKMKKLHDKIISYSDGKREIALQTYNMVDKHIRRLDTEIAKYNDFSPEKSTANKRKNDVQAEIIKGKKKRLKTNKNGSENKNVKIKNEFDDEDSNKSGRKKTLSQSIEGSEVVHETDTKNNVQLLALGSELDMEVDPNEPLYCICHQVSFGEMVGCDDSDCTIEWFHFQCVGLTSKPKGKWYCPQCTAKRKAKHV